MTVKEDLKLGKDEIAYIESGLYDDFEKVFENYIDEYYSSCKVCFICQSETYMNIKNIFEHKNITPIYVFSDDKATLKNEDNVYKVVDNASLICCLDNESINFCKALCKKCNQECIYFLKDMPSLDAFLPLSYKEQNGFLKHIDCEPIKHYIIKYENSLSLKRESLINSVFSTISYFGSFLEMIVDSYIYKYNSNVNLKKEFSNYAFRLKALLDETIFLSDSFLDEYLLFMEDFSSFLIHSNINLDTKENVFCNIYNYLEPKSLLSLDEIRLVGAQSLVKIYAEFFKNLPNISYNYFDIEKKVSLIDGLFKKVDYDIDEFDVQKAEKMNYIVRRFGERLKNKCTSFSCILDSMIDKALDLYKDSGFAFSKKMNNQIALKAIYFTPDFIKGNNFIKLIRDFGVLDYF